MSFNYFVHINSSQTFENRLYNSVRYAICIHWQLHVMNVNCKMLMISFNKSLESHIENCIEIDMKSFSEHLIAQSRSSKHSISEIFHFSVESKEKYHLWVRHYVNKVVTYAKDEKLTVVVRNYNWQVVSHFNVSKNSLLSAIHMTTLNHQILFIMLLESLLY